MERKFVCPCGLTCCDCLFYKIEIYDVAKKLRNLIKDNRFDMFLLGMSNMGTNEVFRKHLDLNNDEYWDRIGKNLNTYKKIPDFMEVLDSIVELQCKSTCHESGGCSMVGNTKKCSALNCIKVKNIDGCWECEEYNNCEHLEFLRRGYGHVINENLSIIKEKGFDAVKSSGDKYYVWQRGGTV